MLTNMSDDPLLYPKISVPELNVLLRCTKKHEYAYRQGLTLIEPPSYLPKGSFLHGLKAPARTRMRLRLGTAEQGCARLRPERPHDVWAVDFVMDTTSDGGRLKLLTVVDEATRYALSVKVSRRLNGRVVVLELERLMTLHGAPKRVRSNNGPAFVACAVRGYVAQTQYRIVVHRAGITVAERLRGKLSCSPVRRMPKSRAVHQHVRSPSLDREVEEALQPGTPTRSPQLPHAQAGARPATRTPSR